MSRRTGARPGSDGDRSYSDSAFDRPRLGTRPDRNRSDSAAKRTQITSR